MLLISFQFHFISPIFLRETILSSPQSGDILVYKEPFNFEWESLPSSYQCSDDGKIKYTLYYWNDASNKKTLTLSSGQVRISPDELSGDTIYNWNIVAKSKYRNSTSSTWSFTVCIPSTPSAPVIEEIYDQAGSSITFRWKEAEFTKTCNRSKDVGYEVYFFSNGTNHTSVTPAFTSRTYYTVEGVTDGNYHFTVRAKNTNKYSEVSEYMNLSICVPRSSGPVLLSYPINEAKVRLRDELYFEVPKMSDKGSQCKIDNNESYTPASYVLKVGAHSLIFNESELDVTTTSDNKEVHHFPGGMHLEYGNVFWSVTYINSDGESRSSDTFSFFACNRPIPPYNMSPPNNITNISRKVEFRWNITDEDFGHKCIDDGSPTVQHTIRLYVDRVNITKLMEEQEVNDTDELDFSDLEPSTLVQNITDIETKKVSFEAELGATYIWRTEAYNDYESTLSEVYVFTVTDNFCVDTDCNYHGNCSRELRMCICDPDYTGTYCEYPVPKNKGNSALGPALGGSLGGIVLIALIIALILFLLMRKSGRKRVVLEGPGGDIRFSRVKVPMAGRDAPDSETAAIEQRIREDCERFQNGAAPEDAFLFAQEYRGKIKSDGIDESVKAVLYTYYKFGCGRELLKLFISGEVNQSQRVETLFRQNSPASTMFKHWSKIVGLDYLFACFSDILKGLIQHEVDAANDKKSDVSLQLFNDTCEVDPTRIKDDEDVEQLLAVNAIQLSLTVQRFATQIYRSVTKIPYEIKDICLHIYSAIEAAYPGHGVRGVSAFLFLRFYSVSISVPEVYGLLKGN